MQERQREFERTRAIYKYALDKLGREKMPELYQQFIAFEKKHGSKEGIEDVIVGKRRLQCVALCPPAASSVSLHCRCRCRSGCRCAFVRRWPRESLHLFAARAC